MGSVDKTTTTNSTGLAVVLGISIRQVQSLTQDGLFPTVSKGTYNLADCVKAYIQKLKEDRSGGKDLAEQKVKADVDYRKQKAKREKLIVDEMEGRLHRSEDVQAMTTDLVYAVRAPLIALPGRLAVDCAAADTPAECSEIIKKEIYSILAELADYKYDPEKYEERVRERLKWEAKEGESNEEED